MPKSKLRGGAKAHNKRVATRNNTLRGLKKKAQAEYQEMFEKTMETLKAQYQASKTTFNCECGSSIISCRKDTHFKSQKHLKFINDSNTVPMVSSQLT